MTTTYEWQFPNFEVGNDNTVKTIHWRYTAVDGDYSASMYGSCGGSEGMDFDAMTKDTAIACVISTSDTTEEDMQSSLSAQIASQVTPELTSKTKDW